MNKTYETICKLVSTAMFGSAISYDEDTDWRDVFSEMKVHGIASLLGDIINDIPMEVGIKEAWKDYFLQQQIHWKRTIHVQDDVCRVLDGIPYVILKGMSVAIYYPNPKLRSIGDIDLLVNKDDFDIAIESIKKNNYLVLQETGIRHNSYGKNGIEIELHNSYATELANAGKSTIEKLIFTKLDDANKIHIKGHIWRALPEIENGLAVLYHIFHHFRHCGVGFRQIIDWMMFVNWSSDIDWNEFNRATKADEIYKFQCVITKMCALYLGLPLKDNIRWANDVDEDACESMFNYITSKGNFGRKMANVDFRYQLTLDNKLKGMIARLQLGGTYRWEATKKNKALRPFAWIYQIIRVIKIIGERKEPIKSIYRDIDESKKIIELYDKLDIPRIDARG